MDPLVGEFVKLGFAGVCLVLVALQYVKVRREKDEQAREHHKEIAALYEKHAQEVRELNQAHEEQLQAMADRHETKGDKATEKITELSVRVTGALEAIARQAERNPAPPRRSIG
jgi:Flp pilus assembly protein TadB